VNPIFFRKAAFRGTLGAIFLASAACAANPGDIGSSRELFVDDLLVASLDGVTLKMHAPVKTPRADSSMPGRSLMTIIKDGDRYRA